MAGAANAGSFGARPRLRLYDPRLLVLFAILLGYVLWPVLQVLGESVWAREGGLTLQPWRDFLDRGHWIYLVRSLVISAASVLLSGIVGTALAFFFFRVEFPGRALFRGLALLPFTLPPLVGVFAIWTLMGEGGPFFLATEKLIGEGVFIETGYTGVLLVHTYSMYVYFYVLVGGALMAMDESQLEAARDLGAGRVTTLLRIVLPQLVPAFAGGALLTFMTSMASFTAPYYYMAGRPVLTVGITQAIEDSMDGLASADCVVLALCAGIILMLLLGYEQTMQGGTRGAARRSVKRPPLPVQLGLLAAALVSTALLLAPHASMMHESFVKRGTGFIGVPREYTLANYTEIWEKPEVWQPFANSLWAAGMATLAVVAFTLASSWVAERREFAGKSAMRLLVMLPWALPGTVIAIGLLWITRRPGLLTWGMDLRATLAILALAYFIRLVPLAHRTIATGLARVPVELEGASRDLGAGPCATFLRVTLPLILPSVLAAATLTFATGLGEFVSSILLQAPDTVPIAVKIDQLRRGPGGVHLAAAYSTVLMIIITLTFVLFGRNSERKV